MSSPDESTPPTSGEQTECFDKREVSVAAMEKINLLLVAISTLLALFWGVDKAIAVFIGGALMGIIFRITVAAMRAIFIKSRNRGWPLVAYWLQYTLMIVVVGVLILEFKIDPAGFLIGLSMIVIAIVAEAIRKLAAQPSGGSIP
jgi:hypothetical protein